MTNTLQGGLGVTPGSGGWRRVEGVVGLHDERVSFGWLGFWLFKGRELMVISIVSLANFRHLKFTCHRSPRITTTCHLFAP